MKKGLVSIISILTGAAAGASIVKRIASKQTDKNKELADKHLALYLLMNQWVKVKQKNKSIAEYLEKNGYREIAIYGMNFVGETLLGELEGTNINAKYAIDKNADGIYSEIDVKEPDGVLEQVDAVIVTPITFFNAIKDMLSQKMDCPILSIEDILYEI